MFYSRWVKLIVTYHTIYADFSWRMDVVLLDFLWQQLQVAGSRIQVSQLEWEQTWYVNNIQSIPSRIRYFLYIYRHRSNWITHWLHQMHNMIDISYYPYAPCTEYLPTFGWFCSANVGKYSIHGAFGLDIHFIRCHCYPWYGKTGRVRSETRMERSWRRGRSDDQASGCVGNGQGGTI